MRIGQSPVAQTLPMHINLNRFGDASTRFGLPCKTLVFTANPKGPVRNGLHYCMLRNRPWALLLCLTGCSDAITHWVVLDYLSATPAELGFKQKALPNINPAQQAPDFVNIDTASSAWIELRVGGDVLFDKAKSLDGGVSRSAMFQGHTQARTNYMATTENGLFTATPQDYDTLLLFTIQAHLHNTITFFASLGIAPPAPALPVYLHPNLITETDFPRTDNAAYSPHADALFLLPMRTLQDIPFSASPGVLAHEYAHRVFDETAFGGQMFQLLNKAARIPGFDATYNQVRAMDEGIADFFGAAISNDPAFLEISLPGALGESRNLNPANPPLLDATWVTGEEPMYEKVYNPYPAGNVLAALLWAIVDILDINTLSRAILIAESKLFENWSGEFDYRIGDFENLLIEALPTTARPAVCTEVMLRYAVAASRFSRTCP